MDTIPSYKDVEEALAGRILALSLLAQDVLGAEPAAVLCQEEPSNPSMLDISRYPVADNLHAFYDYAFNATLGKMFSDGAHIESALELLQDFAGAVAERNGRLADILGSLDWESQREKPWRVIDEMIALVAARSSLDFGMDLTIAEIALLADMSERSVRNALSLPGDAGLHAKRVADAAGEKQTQVDNAEARRWLAGRRGFSPTRRSWVPDDVGAPPENVASMFEFATLVRQRIDAFYGSVETAATASGLSLEWIRDAANFRLELRAENVENLAKLLALDESWIAEQWVRLAMPKQFDLLRQRLSPK